MISGAKLFRGLLLLALLVFGMYLLLKPPQLSPGPLPATQELGRLDADGSYWVRENGELTFLEVQGSAVARELQTLRTPRETQLRVEFIAGGSVLIAEKTLAILDHTPSGLEILIFEGAAQIVEQGDTPITVIHSRLKNWSEEEVNLATKAETPEVSENREANAEGGALSDVYIQEVLERQQRFLRSCFIKYFHRKNGQVEKGRVVLNILIEPTGKVQSARVMSSEIDDEGYIGCLQSVVTRTRFRPFDSAPLSVEYPIDLAL